MSFKFFYGLLAYYVTNHNLGAFAWSEFTLVVYWPG